MQQVDGMKGVIVSACIRTHSDDRGNCEGVVVI